MKQIGKILNQSQTGKKIQDHLRKSQSRHSQIIDDGKSKHFHLGKQFVSRDNIGIAHSNTSDLHYCAFGTIQLKNTGHCVGGLHYSGDNPQEIEKAIYKLKRFNRAAIATVGCNKAAGLDPRYDSFHYHQRDRNVKFLKSKLEQAGFEVRVRNGFGSIAGTCARDGVYQEEQTWWRGLLTRSNSEKSL